MFHSTCFWKLFPSVSFKLLFSLRYIWRNWKPSFFAYIARAESFKTFLQDCTFASAIRNSLFKNISLVLCFPFNRIFLRYFFHVDFLTKNLLYIDLYQIALFPHSNEIKQFPAKRQLYAVPNSNNLKPKNFLFAPYSHSDAIRKIYVKWRTCEIISLKDLESKNVCTAPFSFWNKAKKLSHGNHAEFDEWRILIEQAENARVQSWWSSACMQPSFFPYSVYTENTGSQWVSFAFKIQTLYHGVNWFSSQTRVHSSTKRQYYGALKPSTSCLRFLRCKSESAANSNLTWLELHIFYREW